MINTPTGTAARSDGYEIRRAAIARGVPCITTIAGGMAAARAIAAARVRRARRCVSLQELHANARDGSPVSSHSRATGTGVSALAPLGRRLAEVCEYRRVGAYDILVCDDPEGPEPDPGQFYMLAAAERWGGGADERPFLPRAFSVMRRVSGRLEFMLEAVGPGTQPARRAARRATACGSPARSGSASRRRARTAARCWSAAASAPRRWPSAHASADSRR